LIFRSFRKQRNEAIFFFERAIYLSPRRLTYRVIDSYCTFQASLAHTNERKIKNTPISRTCIF